MNGRLAGRTAIVFGAGSSGPGWGNGKAAAVAYARERARVACVDLVAEAAQETATIIRDEGLEAIAIAADVTDLASIEAAVEAAIEAFGGISILHNNVGVTHMGGPVELDEDKFQTALDLNIGSVYRTAKAVLPHMVEAGGGAIVNISSIASIRYVGYPYFAYYTTKAAVNHATVALAMQYARQGIRANCVMPGLIDTPLIYQQISSQYASAEEMVAARNAMVPLGRMGTAWDVAAAAVFLASDDTLHHGCVSAGRRGPELHGRGDALTMNLALAPDRDQTGAQSVDRALALLSMVGRHAERGVTLSGLVEESELNKPTCRRLLLALMRAGLVEQDEATRRYYIGEEAYVLGSLASRRFGLLQLSMESLLRLSKKTEDSSFLSVRRETFSVCLYREEGTYPVRTHALQAGFEHPLGVGAGSLAMLAALPDAEVEAVLSANADVLVRNYPQLPRARIRQDVSITRDKGYALNPGLLVANSWGIGMVMRTPDGQIAGALSIAAIDSRMQPPRQVELADYLLQEVRVVEGKLASMFASRRSTRDEGYAPVHERMTMK